MSQQHLEAPIGTQIHQNLDIFMIESKYGYIDKTGTIVIDPIFSDARDFNDGLARVKVSGKYGFINKKGQFIIEPKFQDAEDFSEGYAIITDGTEYCPLYGFINTNGIVQIKPQFRSAKAFRNSRAAVMIGDKWGYIDKNGNLVVSPVFSTVCPYYEGLARVTYDTQLRGNRWGFIDLNGEIIVPFIDKSKFGMYGGFSEGLAPVLFGDTNKTSQNHKEEYGYIDKTGRFIIEPRFRDATSFHDGLAHVVCDNNGIERRGFIDKSGKFVLTISNQKWLVSDFNDGIAVVYDFYSKKFGYIDKQGNLVTDIIFENGYDFSEGLAGVKIGEKWGFIDKAGHIVIKPQYESVGSFHEGLACIEIKCNINSASSLKTKVTTRQSSQQQKKEGCYIATMIYGSYDAPEVLILRRYRDDILKQSSLGRLFVKCYYSISPIIVKLFRNAKIIHNIFRQILNLLVSHIKTSFDSFQSKN